MCRVRWAGRNALGIIGAILVIGYIRWKHQGSYNLDGLQLMYMFPQRLWHGLGILGP
jgi:hypothetical protein